MIGNHVVTMPDGTTTTFPPDMSDDDINAAIASQPPPLDPFQQGVKDTSNAVATSIAKGVGNTLGIPHAVGQLIDMSANTDWADLGPPPVDPETVPSMGSAGNWLTRHTLSGEDINKRLFGGISALSTATGGRPVEPYEATSPYGRIAQAGLEPVVPSLIGGGATMVPRMAAGIAGGAGGEGVAAGAPRCALVAADAGVGRLGRGRRAGAQHAHQRYQLCPRPAVRAVQAVAAGG